MAYACIDIGSNTTRLLVAEAVDGQLRELLQQRTFTRIGKGRRREDRIDDEKIAEVARVVATQVRVAEELGAGELRAVATAAIRQAANGDALVGDPDLIFLDEPTTGFDPAARRTAWDTVRSLKGLGKTVLLTTHYLDEA